MGQQFVPGYQRFSPNREMIGTTRDKVRPYEKKKYRDGSAYN